MACLIYGMTQRFWQRDLPLLTVFWFTMSSLSLFSGLAAAIPRYKSKVFLSEENVVRRKWFHRRKAYLFGAIGFCVLFIVATLLRAVVN
jgi:hypothetical protein